MCRSSFRHRFRENPEGASVEVIPGIELSSEYNGKDIHIVGLFIDENSKAFKEHVASFLASRETRNHKMCEKLAEYGFDVSYENLLAYFPDSVITRAHYAKYMMEKGYVKSLKEAFERYLGDHAPCFVPREKISPEQAVSLILSAGGIPVLAHPTLYHMGDEALETLVARLKDSGLLAIEGIYSTYTPSDTRKIQSIAKNSVLPSAAAPISTVKTNPDFPSVPATEDSTSTRTFLPA